MDENEDLDYLSRVNKLYSFIIKKYQDYIESSETRSIADMPRLVTPESERVADVVSFIKSKFPSYLYENDFYGASLQALEYMKNNIKDIVMPVQFWLKPDAVINLGLGEDIDKNVLLCSLLIALGNYSSKVLVVSNDSKKRVFVYYEFNYRFFLIDIKGEIELFDSNKDLFSYVGIDDNSDAYEFNNLSYFKIV